MDLRKSILKPFKKLKSKLLGGRRKRDGRSGNEDNRKGGEVDIEESEASERISYLRSEVEIGIAVEGGPSREGSNVNWKDIAPVNDPPTSTPPISQSGGLDSM